MENIALVSNLCYNLYAEKLCQVAFSKVPFVVLLQETSLWNPTPRGMEYCRDIVLYSYQDAYHNSAVVGVSVYIGGCMAVIKSVHQMAEEVAQEALTNILVCGQPLGVWIQILAKYP